MDHREHIAVAGVQRGHLVAAFERDDAAGGAPPQQVDTDEIRDEARARVTSDLVHEAGLDDATALEDHEPVRERRRFERIVRDQQPRSVEGREMAAELAADLDARRRVER